MTDRIIEIAKAIHSSRFHDAIAVFAAGFLLRGEGTAFSDLDLVVVYARIQGAYRESFRLDGCPVEAFVHDREEERYARYVVSDLLDDLEDPRSREEAIDNAARLYERLADCYLRRRCYCQTFETLFTTGQSRVVIQLAEDILRPAGGRLFDGYRAEAPTHCKKPPPSA